MMYRYNVCNVPVGLVARGDEGLMFYDILTLNGIVGLQPTVIGHRFARAAPAPRESWTCIARQ